MPSLLGGRASEPPAPPGPCPAQRTRFVIGPGPDAGGSNEGKAGRVQTREKSGIDAAPRVWLTTGPAAVVVCAMAGIAATVATVTKRRKSRCMDIGRLPFMSLACPDPAAALCIAYAD